MTQPDAEPVCITESGKSAAVLLSIAEYKKMRLAQLDQKIDAVSKDFYDLNDALNRR